MGDMIGKLFGGGDNGADLARAQAAASQRQALAAEARAAAQVDQAASSTSGGAGRRGRRLLTALGADGASTLA